MQPVLRMCATRCKFHYIGLVGFFKGDFAQNPTAKRQSGVYFARSATAVPPFISSRWGFALNSAPCKRGFLQNLVHCEQGFLQDSAFYERGFLFPA